MKKIYTSVLAVFGLVASAWGQNPGMLISEFHQNPGGLDSPFEYVELLVTDDIDFSVTPYTVIVANNGTATVDGWIEGGSITYAFEITSGIVSVGDVVYVGGTDMAPTGTKLRMIDTGVDDGDGSIGNNNTGGVFGNGGGNADGIAVFDMDVASITSSTVPTDALFYGSGIGGAAIDGVSGYQLPVNDHYDGGKLLEESFYGADEDLTELTGVYNLETFEFVEARTFASGEGTDGVSLITFADEAPAKVSFVTEEITLNENVGTVSFDLDLIDANGSASSCDIKIVSISSATNEADFILLDTTVSFTGDVDETMSFSFEIIDDVDAEQSEYIVVSAENFVNAELFDITEMFIYITDNDRVIPTATNELNFELLTSFSNGEEGEASAEIVAFDESSDRLVIANSVANVIDIVDFSVPESPVLLESIGLDSIGEINSIAVYDGVIAAAIAAPIPQDPGFVSFFSIDGDYLNRLTVGALPDMVTFNHAGDMVAVACEGEPNDGYDVDPLGGVSLIEISGAIDAISPADVTNLDFTAFDADAADLMDAGLRVFGPESSLSQDIEPEYVTILPDDMTAHVVCQENNAIAVVDLIAKEITEIRILGTIDHSLFGFGLDASNRTSDINIANFPIKGFFMPDAIDNITVDGATYLVTANEGDSRDYDGYSEEERIEDLELDETLFPNAAYWQNELLLGRLKTTSVNGDIDGDGDFDELYSYGTRSFSIWNEATGELVFDSGDLIEQIIANDPVYVELFNASNEDEAEAKNRSDDKGPEPEGVLATVIEGNAFLFVSLERIGGAMAFNINDPENPIYVGYHNNRDAETNGPDRGAEGMIFIPAELSPNGNGILVLANEVSSSLSIYQINSCVELSELEITTIDDQTSFCEGGELELFATEDEDLTYQWYLNEEMLDGAMDQSFIAETGGEYKVSIYNAEYTCEGTSEFIEIEELDAPMPIITVTEGELFTDSYETYQWYFEGELIDGATEMSYFPTEDGAYTVVVTNEDGCIGEATYDVEYTGVKELSSNTFNIYPNPTNGIITIELGEDINQNTDILIYDIAGHVAYRGQVDSYSQHIDLTDLSSGVYFVKVDFATKSISKKLIIK